MRSTGTSSPEARLDPAAPATFAAARATPEYSRMGRCSRGALPQPLPHFFRSSLTPLWKRGVWGGFSEASIERCEQYSVPLRVRTAVRAFCWIVRGILSPTRSNDEHHQAVLRTCQTRLIVARCSPPPFGKGGCGGIFRGFH